MRIEILNRCCQCSDIRDQSVFPIPLPPCQKCGHEFCETCEFVESRADAEWLKAHEFSASTTPLEK